MFEALFNPENAFMSFINKVIDLVVLSIVFTLCCIPIVTIGTAWAALYYAVVKTVRRHRSYAVREFWHAFKDNLRQGVIVHIIWLLFAFMMLVTDLPLVLTLLESGKVQNVILLILFGMKAFILLGAVCWVYPLMSRFRESLWKLLQASVFNLLRCFLITLLSVVFVVIAVASVVLEPLLLSFVPGLMMLVLSLIQEPVLRKLCREQATNSENKDMEEKDTWYLE